MLNIFTKEEQVISHALDLLSSNQFNTAANQEDYRALLEEYQVLLKQVMRMVKISDMMQLELKNMSSKLKIASQTDVLTGLYNRRFFNEVYQKEWKNALRVKSPISLLMMDVDYFKKYNDNYGHLQGDECLIMVSKAIQSAVRRPRDVAARFGGEEFIILLPDTDSDGSVVVANKLMTGIEKMDLEHSASLVSNRVTASMGIASIIPDEKVTMDNLLNMVDNALYTAKNDGRNCYRLYH